MTSNKLLYQVRCTSLACEMSGRPREVQGHLLKSNLYCLKCGENNSFEPTLSITERQPQVSEEVPPSTEQSLEFIVEALHDISHVLSERTKPVAGSPRAPSSPWMMLIPDFTELQDERMKRVGRAIFDSMMKVVESKMVEFARSLQEKIRYELQCNSQPSSGTMQNIASQVCMDQIFFDQQQLFEAAQVGLKSFYA